MRISIIAGLFVLSINSAQSEILTCDQVSTVLVDLPAPDARPYCDTAELRCRGLKLLHKRPENDELRKLLEPKLTAQVEYELEVCEMAIRDIDPAYLKPRSAE